MKKILALTLALLMTASLLAGCGCEKDKQSEEGNGAAVTENAEGENASSEGGETASEGGTEEAPVNPPELPAVSENKEVVTKEQAPKVYYITGGEGSDSLTYHLEGCADLEGKEYQEISWEMVSTIGFWQCPTCNPPRYEDYKNAE